MKKSALWLLGLLACGDSSSADEQRSVADAGEKGADDAVGGEAFGKSTPVADGYTRYYSTVREVGPGQSVMLVEWVAEAFEEDMDVMDVRGGQTLGGHHATLTSSPAVEPLGTVRTQVVEDQLTATFLGAVGGEGQGAGALSMPENYAFRLRKGEGLYIQSHYINTTEAPISVRSYLDVELAKPSKDHVVLSLFSNGTVSNQLAPGAETKMTVECETQEDLPLVMFTNHLHEWGTAIRTEAVLADGSVLVVKDDPAWNTEWVNNSNYTYAFEEPVVVPKGSMLRTHCTWENTTDRELTFPDEMCAFVAFLPGDEAITCLDGTWSKSAGAAAAPTASKPLVRVGDGACSGDADFSALPDVRDECLALPGKDIAGCGIALFQGDAQCIVDCFVEGDVSADCGTCHGDLLHCSATMCQAECTAGLSAEGCVSCMEEKCCSEFEACSGLSC